MKDVEELPKWKILGFEDVLHYLDFKRNNDLDSIINDIDDSFEFCEGL